MIVTEGQTIEINFGTGQVFISRSELYKPYIADATLLSYDMVFSQTVTVGHMFTMGDNRNNSWDSKELKIGVVDNQHIFK